MLRQKKIVIVRLFVLYIKQGLPNCNNTHVFSYQYVLR
ncbi:hypothetical protein UNSWDHB_2022 [Dehalobacter sp. UNSWDHB]|nr:hypothetical protein DHBDCA_p858 [Dehalobacter sp. DCA]AFV04924.1 hypothetical protein DCF50_p917 [Dehalobacter sp. CF]EQB20693.1 hypothetical protein UNSWDHB_2022 [Dehalobacter sp. UNSWDHB]